MDLKLRFRSGISPPETIMHAFPIYFHTFWLLEHQNACFSYLFSYILASLKTVDLKLQFRSGIWLPIPPSLVFLCIFIHSGFQRIRMDAFPIYFLTFWPFYRGWILGSGSDPESAAVRSQQHVWSLTHVGPFAPWAL